MNRRWLAVLTLLLTTACPSLTAACSGLTLAPTTPTVGCPRPDGVILIIGAHRDAPAPSLSSSQDPRVACLVTATITDKKPSWIVVADGQPTLIRPKLVTDTGMLAQQDSPWESQDVERTESAVAAARPRSAGVDDLAALALAADAARSADVPHAWLVLLDSGLDDRGALDFTVPGLLAADPAEVARQLQRDGNLPNLRGFTVVLAGVGYTAPPQVQPSVKWRDNITAIWTAAMVAAGARVEVIPVPAQGASIQTGEPVKQVPVPAVLPLMPVRGRTIVLDGQSAARFRPNSTAFADLSAAARALARIAGWLAANPARHARLVGTTADVGSMTGQVRLSVQRADRVRAELVALGALPTQISVTGVGSDFPQFTADRSPSGTLLAGPATLNRSVRVKLSGPGSSR